MGREVRRVAAGWEHPSDEQGNYIPLFGGSFSRRAAEWDRGHERWCAGQRPIRDIVVGEGPAASVETIWGAPDEAGRLFADTWGEYAGPRPVATDYLPDWPEDEASWWQLYENVTEGTPVSPAFSSITELRAWLVEHGDRFSDAPPSEASVDQLLQRGSAPSFVFSGGEVRGWERQDDAAI